MNFQFVESFIIHTITCWFVMLEIVVNTSVFGGLFISKHLFLILPSLLFSNVPSFAFLV